MSAENAISLTQNLLLVLGEPPPSAALAHVVERFCGEVAHGIDGVDVANRRAVYACGDIRLLGAEPKDVRVIRELSTHVDARPGVAVVGVGRVPLQVHRVGVLYRRFFDEPDLFDRIRGEHRFQNLTESTKRSKALRTGIYLTDVAREVTADGREVLRHRLLRCSSNFDGPTDNLRATDRLILGALQRAADEVFEQKTDLNHVLAQIYENRPSDGPGSRERKARISRHSDKTKDMRADGLIAFCTFYDPGGFAGLEPGADDVYDWRYKTRSGLTRLDFRLKGGVDAPGLVEGFSVTLYPNSVFIIPLSTNRLYTHAIQPPVLNAERIPTRMGYVVRCSKAEARFMDGRTWLEEDGRLIALQPMTRETLAALRSRYFEENSTADVIRYGDVRFSMNAGDYQKPIH